MNKFHFAIQFDAIQITANDCFFFLMEKASENKS